MQTIEASFEIVTPMFIGGGDNDVELRPPSIKGALRFWWRALHWGQCLQAENNNESRALKLLHEREAELFGAAAKENTKRGQAAFLLKVKTKNLEILTKTQLDADRNYQLTTHKWHSYLLGLGLSQANHYLRPAIVSGSFTVKILCKKTSDSEELKNLLLLWGLLGGLGSRQRKGFGSISITELKVGDNPVDLPKNRDEVIAKLKSLIDKSAINEPPFSAFSFKSKILCSEEDKNTPWQKLDDVAKEMQMFRGWGYKRNDADVHRINGLEVNHTVHKDKDDDHTFIYEYADHGITPKKLPNSISFGLPRSYKLSGANGSEFKLEATGDKRSRRASPVFIHVHQFPTKQTMIIQSFLPATFLPTTDQVEIQRKVGNRWNSVACVTPKNNWNVINEYLALFKTPQWQEV
jgi:CRISPR-associated protein Cmr1